MQIANNQKDYIEMIATTVFKQRCTLGKNIFLTKEATAATPPRHLIVQTHELVDKTPPHSGEVEKDVYVAEYVLKNLKRKTEKERIKAIIPSGWIQIPLTWIAAAYISEVSKEDLKWSQSLTAIATRSIKRNMEQTGGTVA